MDGGHVALTKCYFCGGPGDLVLATRFRTDSRGYTFPIVNIKEKCHGKVLNMEPCQGCVEYMKVGIILISVRDGEMAKVQSESRVEGVSMPNPYRTGCFTVMREEAARRLFTGSADVFKRRWAFIEDTLWQRIGLPVANEDHTHPNEAKGPIGECQVCKTRRQLNTTWSRSENGMTLNARCLTCNPDEGDRLFTLVPHTLLLYEFPGECGKSRSTNEGESSPN